MSVTADVLRELHSLHQRRAELERALARGPKQIKTKEQTVRNMQAELEAARERRKQAQMTLDKKQQELKIVETKIADYQTKLNTCNSNREYQLLLEQIAADEMAKSVHEDEILEALDKQETLKAAIVTAEENLEKGKQELERTQQKVEQESAGLQQRIELVRAELSKAEKSLPADFRPEYDRLVSHRGDDAMAEVEEGICAGCHQRVTPNMQAELSMRRVVVCKGCGRLLYAV